MTLYIKTNGPIPEGCDYLTAGKVYPVFDTAISAVDGLPCDGYYETDNGYAYRIDLRATSLFHFCDASGNPVPAPWEEAAPAKAVQCQCFSEPDWPSPEFAKGVPICEEFLAMDRDPGICERCEHNEACHVPQVDYRAHAEALAEALRKLACLGNGDRPGNSEGNIIAQQALAAFDQDKTQPTN